MFIGHFGAGFAVKRAAPRLPLAACLAGACLPDLIWTALLLAGVERAQVISGEVRYVPIEFIHYPWSHSLLMTAAWALAYGALCGRWLKSARAGAWAGLAVLSHWPLDALSHRPDLQLFPGGGLRLGFGLWDWLPATLLVEGGLFAAGLWLYARAARPRSRAGAVAFWSFAVFHAALFLGSLFGPPPPDIRAAAAGNIFFVVTLVWASWMDRLRPILSR